MPDSPVGVCVLNSEGGSRPALKFYPTVTCVSGLAAAGALEGVTNPFFSGAERRAIELDQGAS